MMKPYHYYLDKCITLKTNQIKFHIQNDYEDYLSVVADYVMKIYGHFGIRKLDRSSYIAVCAACLPPISPTV